MLKLVYSFLKNLLLLVLVGLLLPFKGSSQDEIGVGYQEVAHIDVLRGSSIAWSPDGAYLAVVDFPAMHIFNTASWVSELTIPDAQVSEVVWSPDGGQLASVQGGGDESLLIWDSSTGDLDRRIVRPYDGPGDGYVRIYRLSWSPDGERIASDSTGLSVLIWDLQEEEVSLLEGHESNGVGETDWSPDSTQVVSGGADGTIRIWDVTRGENIVTVEGGLFVDWHPGAAQIAGTGLSDNACVWDADAGRQLFCVEHGDTVLSVRWNFDGTLIATGGLDGVIRVWSSASGEPIEVIREHSDAISMLAWHPDRNLLASVGFDGNVWVWQFSE